MKINKKNAHTHTIMDDMVTAIDEVVGPPEVEAPDRTSESLLAVVAANDRLYQRSRRESSIMCEVLDQLVKESTGIDCQQVESYSQLLELQPPVTPGIGDEHQSLQALFQCSNGDSIANADSTTAYNNLMHSYYSQTQEIVSGCNGGVGTCESQYGGCVDGMGQMAGWTYDDQLYNQQHQYQPQEQHYHHQQQQQQYHHQFVTHSYLEDQHQQQVAVVAAAAVATTTTGGQLTNYQHRYPDPPLTATSTYTSDPLDSHRFDPANYEWGHRESSHYYSQYYHLQPVDPSNTSLTNDCKTPSAYVAYRPQSPFGGPVNNVNDHSSPIAATINTSNSDSTTTASATTITSSECLAAEHYVSSSEYINHESDNNNNSYNGDTSISTITATTTANNNDILESNAADHQLEQRTYADTRYDPNTNNNSESLDGHIIQSMSQPYDNVGFQSQQIALDYEQQATAVTVHHTTENNTYFSWSGCPTSMTNINTDSTNIIPQVSENYDPTVEIGSCLIGDGDEADYEDDANTEVSSAIDETRNESATTTTTISSSSSNNNNSNNDDIRPSTSRGAGGGGGRKSTGGSSGSNNKYKSQSSICNGQQAPGRPVLAILRNFLLNRMAISANQSAAPPTSSAIFSSYSPTISSSVDMTSDMTPTTCCSGANDLTCCELRPHPGNTIVCNAATNNQQHQYRSVGSPAVRDIPPRPLRSSRRLNVINNNTKPEQQLPVDGASATTASAAAVIVQHHPEDSPVVTPEARKTRSRQLDRYAPSGSLCSMSSSPSSITQDQGCYSSDDESHENRISRGLMVPTTTRTSPSPTCSPSISLQTQSVSPDSCKSLESPVGPSPSPSPSPQAPPPLPPPPPPRQQLSAESREGAKNRQLRSRTVALSTRNRNTIEELPPRSIPHGTPATGKAAPMATCCRMSTRRRSSYISKVSEITDGNNNNNSNTNDVSSGTNDELDRIQTRASKRRKLNNSQSSFSSSSSSETELSANRCHLLVYGRVRDQERSLTD